MCANCPGLYALAAGGGAAKVDERKFSECSLRLYEVEGRYHSGFGGDKRVLTIHGEFQRSLPLWVSE